MDMVFYFLVLAALGLAAAQVMASRGFRAKSLALGARLRAGQAPVDVSARLPAAVRDFALRGGADASAGLRAVSFTQTGEIRRARGGPFVTLGAWQIVALGKPGFLWEARIDAGPLQGIRMIDALAGGAALHEERWLGSVPTTKAAGEATMLAAAYRYLGELPLVPDAILTNPDLVWEMANGRTASVSLATPAGTARVAFLFDDAGDIVGMRARGRPMPDDPHAERPDWQARFTDYAAIGPRRVPSVIEMGYAHPAGYEAVFRARLTEYHIAV